MSSSIGKCTPAPVLSVVGCRALYRSPFRGTVTTSLSAVTSDRTHTLGKLMNNNTVAQLEAIFDFEDMDEPFGIAKTKKKDTNKKKAYYVAYLIICLKHNCGEDMPGWKPIPNELQ